LTISPNDLNAYVDLGLALVEEEAYAENAMVAAL
jgi:hypothetical protein